MPAGWKVVDGALTRVGDGGDIITTEQYRNFELTLEWKISPGGNSGIMYRVTEDADATYETGPEMQVLDDAGHADGQVRLTAAGSLLRPLRRAGGHRQAGGRVEPGADHRERQPRRALAQRHQGGGVRAGEPAIGRPGSRRASSRSGRATAARPTGFIALQDHGDWVAYRRIKIRVLP